MTQKNNSDLTVSDMVNLSALELASLQEHKWFLSEKENRPVDIDDARIDWSFRGFRKWVTSAYKTNREKVRDYISKRNKDSYFSSNVPTFSSLELHQLLGYRS